MFGDKHYMKYKKSAELIVLRSFSEEGANPNTNRQKMQMIGKKSKSTFGNR